MAILYININNGSAVLDEKRLNFKLKKESNNTPNDIYINPMSNKSNVGGYEIEYLKGMDPIESYFQEKNSIKKGTILKLIYRASASIFYEVKILDIISVSSGHYTSRGWIKCEIEILKDYAIKEIYSAYSIKTMQASEDSQKNTKIHTLISHTTSLPKAISLLKDVSEGYVIKYNFNANITKKQERTKVYVKEAM